MTQQNQSFITETFKVKEGRLLTVHQVPALIHPETGEVAFSMSVVAALDVLKGQAAELGLTEMQFDPALIPTRTCRTRSAVNCDASQL